MGEQLSLIQKTFSGGFNRIYDPTKLSRDAYPLLVNGRLRDEMIRPIQKPVRFTSGLPASYTRFQGGYAAGNISLVFIDGAAYYRNHELINSAYVQITGFQMDAGVETIFAELVPASSINFERKAASSTDAAQGVTISSPIDASQTCVVCQDGVSQPQLIFSNGTTAPAQNWSQWSLSNREYVPIGKQMLYQDGVLYIVAPDGISFYRSVTGRPLDFIICVDTNGNKLGTESESGAQVMSHAVSYDPITAIRRSNTQNKEFILSTRKATWLVRPRLDTLIYGEPVFSNQFLFDTGAVNQFSICELLGDTALIDTASIRSFNSVLNTANEGKNTPFSRMINSIFEGVVQPDTACAFPFDNYSLFSVYSVYGPIVMVYDNLTEKFVGFDIYAGVAAIRQFFEVKVGTTRELFFITTDHKLYKAFASTSRETCKFYFGDLTSDDPEINLSIDTIQSIFLNSKEAGIVYATVFVDGKQSGDTLTDTVKEILTPEAVPISFPFGPSDKDRAKPINFKINQSFSGWAVGVMFEWSFDTCLSTVKLILNKERQRNSYEGQAHDMARYSSATKISLERFTPSTGGIGTVVLLIGVGFLNVTDVKLNNVSLAGQYQILDDNSISIIIPSTATSGTFRISSANDEVESATTFTVT